MEGGDIVGPAVDSYIFISAPQVPGDKIKASCGIRFHLIRVLKDSGEEFPPRSPGL